MSRKQTIAAQKLLAEQALYQKQGLIWIRSLERNDADIAAVIDLNRSLHAVKQAFIKNYDNELLLLNIGQGVYCLSPDGSDHLVKPTVVPLHPSNVSPNKALFHSSNLTPDKSLSNTDDPNDLMENAEPPQSTIQYPSIPYDEISAEQQELCVDFLLRLKLRRKLLSRIFRRLNRIATSMDHIENSVSSSSATNMPITDVVAPPGPPKYGDLRLHCDPESVQQFAELKQKQNAAWSRIAAAREQASLFSSGFGAAPGENAPTTLEGDPTHLVEPDPPNEEEVESREIPEGTAVPLETKREEEMEPQHSVENQVAAAPLLDNSTMEPVVAESKEVTPAAFEQPLETMAVDPIVPSTEASSDVAMPDVESSASCGAGMVPAADLNAPNDVHKEGEEVLAHGNEAEEDLDIHDPLAADYAILKDYKDAYEKLVDITVSPLEDATIPNLHALPSSHVRYSILQEEREEDYMAIKTGSGIGATHQSMSTKEREMEFHRWQANVLARIPEQPTYAELGFEHRVFYAEERRERALKRMQEQEDEERSKKKRPSEDEDAVTMDEDKDHGAESLDEGHLTDNLKEVGLDQDTAIIQKNEESGETEENADSRSKNVGEEDEDDEKEDGDDVKIPEGVAEGEEAKNEKLEPKIVRPISLAAIPSFYEQDLKRIKLVQAELMSSSLRVHAIKRLEETTREFNQALKNSMDLANHRTYLQNQINQLGTQIRTLSQNVQSDYVIQVALAKNVWNLERRTFETNKLNQMLPSRNGCVPMGTQMTQAYKSIPSHMVGLPEIVADCVADLVDCVDNIAQGRIRNDRFSELFVPPKPSSDVEALHNAKQVESTKRNELNTYTLRLRTSEGERLRAWRKMLKTKAEFDIPHQHYSSSGQIRILHLDQNLCNSLPLPALHLTATQGIPQELPGKSFVASYTPMHTVRPPPSSAHISDSKYSTARVRERIASDGTVAPVSKPKITKEGLYQRPAGRTRKGMEWDAVRGIWIPAGEIP